MMAKVRKGGWWKLEWGKKFIQWRKKWVVLFCISALNNKKFYFAQSNWKKNREAPIWEERPKLTWDSTSPLSLQKMTVFFLPCCWHLIWTRLSGINRGFQRETKTSDWYENSRSRRQHKIRNKCHTSKQFPVNVYVPAAIMIVNHFKIVIHIQTMWKCIKSISKRVHYHSEDVTCNLGGDGSGQRGAKAFIGGGFEGENVGGSRVETHK